MNFIRNVFFGIVLILCSCVYSQNKIDETSIADFSVLDSLNIKIEYKELNGCVDLSFGKIIIMIQKNHFRFYHIGSNSFVNESFNGTNENIIQHFIEFENSIKENDVVCSGIDGDHCFEVEIHVKNSIIKLLYKRNGNKGISALYELIKNIRKHKQ